MLLHPSAQLTDGSFQTDVTGDGRTLLVQILKSSGLWLCNAIDLTGAVALMVSRIDVPADSARRFDGDRIGFALR